MTCALAGECCWDGGVDGPACWDIGACGCKVVAHSPAIHPITLPGLPGDRPRVGPSEHEWMVIFSLAIVTAAIAAIYIWAVIR